MSESLRDRVARVLYGVWCAQIPDADFDDFEDAHESDTAEHYQQADALIAAGLVRSPLRDSETVERIGDRVGPNYPELANRLWATASALRTTEVDREAL